MCEQCNPLHTLVSFPSLSSCYFLPYFSVNRFSSFLFTSAICRKRIALQLSVFVAEVAELLAQIFPNAFDALNISSVPVDVLATPNDGVNEAEGRFELPYHIFPVDKTAAMN